MERRDFLEACSLLAGAAALAATGPSTADAPPRYYRRVKLVDIHGVPIRAAKIVAETNYVFQYPYAATPCFLLKLPKAAGPHAALRREDASLGQKAVRLHGATLDDRTLVLRFVGRAAHEDRLVVVNLGPDHDFACAPEPLVAPPALFAWQVLWCSEDPAYGGVGIAGSSPPAKLVATGQATTVFRPGLVPL